MIVAIVAWLLCAGLCYVFLRRATYNVADPLVFDNVATPFSAALLAVLVAAGLVPPEKLGLFTIILVAFLAGARAAMAFFSRKAFRQAILRAVARLSKAEVYAVLLATIVVTILVTVLAIQSGGLGDGRAEFNRTFRPLAVLRSGLFDFSLLVLLSPKLSNKQIGVWLTTLILLSIAFSGKSVFIPVFYWFGLKFFLLDKRISLVMMTALAGVTLVGSALMALLAYGASSAFDVLLVIVNRFWMYGDVYIYAYKLDALQHIRDEYDPSFIAYMMHPLTSLVGIRAYEKPLGSMLMSDAIQQDVLAGPNPQLPVLLDFFFPGQLVAAAGIAFTIGLCVYAVRAIGLRLARGRSRYIAIGGIAAAVFCPAAGFVDTSQVLITLIGICVVTAAATTLEVLLSRRRGRRAHPLVVPSAASG